MIAIKKNITADTRTCDWTKVSKEQLLESSIQHRSDIVQGIGFFTRIIEETAIHHDDDKLIDIDGFYRDFQTGFKRTEWWDRHRKNTRHHLVADDGIPDNVNLIDVLEMITDCVMAGMARAGYVYPVNIKTETLMKAFHNTVDLLKSVVVVEG